MSPSPALSSSERRVYNPTASLFRRGGIEGDLHLSVHIHLSVDLAFVNCYLACVVHVWPWKENLTQLRLGVRMVRL